MDLLASYENIPIIPYSKPSRTRKTFFVHIPITESLGPLLGYLLIDDLLIFQLIWLQQMFHGFVFSTVYRESYTPLFFLSSDQYYRYSVVIPVNFFPLLIFLSQFVLGILLFFTLNVCSNQVVF